jgi:hypothetical protein
MKSLNRTFSRPETSDRTEDLALDADARWGCLPVKERLLDLIRKTVDGQTLMYKINRGH